MKKENEELKEEIDNLNFKIKLSQEKEKLQETNLKTMKEIQFEYENKILENKKEYKLKEENIRNKYESFEECFNQKIKALEDENLEKFQKLNLCIKESQRALEKKGEEILLLKEKLKNSELFFTQKEQEFINLIGIKDKKLNDLEICIKKISEEAKIQLDSLNNVIEEYDKKVVEFKIKEKKLLEELNFYKDNNLKTIKPDYNPLNTSTYYTTKNIANTERDLLNKISSNKSKISFELTEVSYI